MNAGMGLAGVDAATLALLTPFVGAALVALVPHARTSWALAVVAAAISAAASFDVLARGAAGALHPDGVGFFVAPLLAAIGLLSLLGLGARLGDIHERAAPSAAAFMLVMLGGAIGAVWLGDLFAIAVAIQVAWLAGVALVALTGDRDRTALSGALRMLTAGSVASALMFIGAGMLARAIGGSELATLADTQIASSRLAGVGIGLMILATAIMAGAAPLHFWVGAAFGRAGGAVAMALGALIVVAALALLLRLSWYALAAPAIGAGVAAALMALGGVSVLAGSLHALGARNLGRLAAYAGIAQAGCVLLSVALGSPAGYAAALVQLVALAASALALLGGAAAIGGQGLAALDGVGRRAPLASVAITFGALSLMGAPLTLGFFGRWRLIEAGVNVGWWWAPGAVMLASLAAVFYGGRLIERMYFRKAGAPFAGGGDPWRLALAPALLVAIALTASGFHPEWLWRAADVAAARMLGHPL